MTFFYGFHDRFVEIRFDILLFKVSLFLSALIKQIGDILLKNWLLIDHLMKIILCWLLLLIVSLVFIKFRSIFFYSRFSAAIVLTNIKHFMYIVLIG
jgi:hypothetical protein